MAPTAYIPNRQISNLASAGSFKLSNQRTLSFKDSKKLKQDHLNDLIHLSFKMSSELKKKKAHNTMTR